MGYSTQKRMDRRIKPDIVMNYSSILGAAYQPMWFDSIIWMLNFMICYPWKPINPLNFDSCGHFLKWWWPSFIHLGKLHINHPSWGSSIYGNSIFICHVIDPWCPQSGLLKHLLCWRNITTSLKVPHRAPIIFPSYSNDLVIMSDENLSGIAGKLT